LRPRLGSIESGYNITTTKELKRIFNVYDFLVENVYAIYGVIEDDGTSQIFLTCSEKLLLKKEEQNDDDDNKEKLTLNFKEKKKDIILRQIPHTARVSSPGLEGQEKDDVESEITKLRGRLKKSRETTKEVKINLEIAKSRISLLEQFIIDKGLQLPTENQSEESEKRSE